MLLCPWCHTQQQHSTRSIMTVNSTLLFVLTLSPECWHWHFNTVMRHSYHVILINRSIMIQCSSLFYIVFMLIVGCTFCISRSVPVCARDHEAHIVHLPVSHLALGQLSTACLCFSSSSRPCTVSAVKLLRTFILLVFILKIFHCFAFFHCHSSNRPHLTLQSLSSWIRRCF